MGDLDSEGLRSTMLEQLLLVHSCIVGRNTEARSVAALRAFLFAVEQGEKRLVVEVAQEPGFVVLPAVEHAHDRDSLSRRVH